MLAAGRRLTVDKWPLTPDRRRLNALLERTTEEKIYHENTKGGKHERRGGGLLSWLVLFSGFCSLTWIESWLLTADTWEWSASLEGATEDEIHHENTKVRKGERKTIVFFSCFPIFVLSWLVFGSSWTAFSSLLKSAHGRERTRRGEEGPSMELLWRGQENLEKRPLRVRSGRSDSFWGIALPCSKQPSKVAECDSTEQRKGKHRKLARSILLRAMSAVEWLAWFRCYSFLCLFWAVLFSAISVSLWWNAAGCLLPTSYCILVLNMRDVYLTYDLGDHGGRRIGLERRRFSYSEHIPERRCGEDRRSGIDRRTGVDRRSGMDRRAAADRRSTSGGDRRVTPNRRDTDERRGSDERRAILQDRRRVPGSKEASHERRGQELQDLLER